MAFSRALRQLHVITLSLDRLTVYSMSLVKGNPFYNTLIGCLAPLAPINSTLFYCLSTVFLQ